MATPHINHTPEPPLAILGSPRPAKTNSDKPTDAPDLRILQTLRAGQRRHPCRRGNCMTLQAPGRKRGIGVVSKLKNRDATIRAYFKKHGGQHIGIGRPRQPPLVKQNQANRTYGPGLRHRANNKLQENRDAKTDKKEEPGNHRPPTITPEGPRTRKPPNY